MVFHLAAAWLPGGFVGVDVFFVISGYLITAIILKEHSSHAFSLKNFWLRRIRRIAPAMLLMLLASLIAGYFILLGASRASLGWQSISTLMLSANTMMWGLADNYWAPSAGMIPLLHTWSLSIEEQFYLIYPLFILGCLRWFPKRLALCLPGIFTLSLALCIYVTFHFPSAAFYSLTTRAWELAGGCLLAALAGTRYLEPQGSPGAGIGGLPAVHRSLAMLGLALIAASFFAIKAEGFPGFVALMPVLGSMLVIQFAGAKSCLVASLLSFPLMRFVGRISYSLYLWHWPVLVLGRAVRVRWENIPAWPWLLLLPVLAVAAYYTVELPGRHLRHPLPFVVPGACAVIALAACLALMPGYNTSKFAPTVWIGDTYSVVPSQSPLSETLLDGITIPVRDAKNTNAYSQGGIVKRYGGENVDVLLLGNSHALMWAPVIDEICQAQHFTVLFYAAGGVYPFPSIPPKRKIQPGFSYQEWFVFESNRMSLIRERHPRLVIIAGRWSQDAVDYRVSRFLEEVSNINRLGQAGQRSEVLFIEDPPELALGGLNAPQFCSTTPATTVKVQPFSSEQLSASALRSFSQRYPWVHSVPTADVYLTSPGSAKVRDGDAVLYTDNAHLSLAGARMAKERISSAITNIIQKSPPR